MYRTQDKRIIHHVGEDRDKLKHMHYLLSIGLGWAPLSIDFCFINSAGASRS
jgi:hypothetical protein